VYQYKKNEAQKKLEKTKENVEKVQSLRREVAPHLQFLERQIKKIERSLQLREELIKVYAEYLKREDTYIAHHYDRLTAERKEPASKLETYKEELAKAKEVLASSKNDEKSTALVSFEEKISEVRKQRQELLRKSGQIEGQLLFLQRRIKQLQEKSAADAGAVIEVQELEKVIHTIEAATEKALKSADVSFLQRSLKDIVHILRKFIVQAAGTAEISTDDEEREFEELQRDQKECETKIAAAEKEESALTADYDELKSSIEAEQSESRNAEREVFRIIADQRECENIISKIDQELAVLERDRAEFKRELQEAVALIGAGASAYFSFEIIVDGNAVSNKEIASEDRQLQKDRRRELEKLKIRLEELGGVNQDVEKEYKEVKGRDDFLVHEIADLEASIVKLEELIAELTASLNNEFIAGIDKIGVEFNRFFALMFGGGEAKLLRVKPKVKKEKDEFGEDIEDVEEEDDETVQEGIELDVKLPNKRVRGLDMLSGGERALTSIALIFAMSQVNPPLFIILDETDAALDEANSRRYGDMIEALAERSQLILITHNRETMSRAGILYGVTMGSDGVSKLLSVKFDEAVAVAK
jgi:chromosome segregation protein